MNRIAILILCLLVWAVAYNIGKQEGKKETLDSLVNNVLIEK